MRHHATIARVIAAGALLVASASALRAQGPFTITVNVTSKSHHEATKGDHTKATASGDSSADKTMEITVLNRTAQEYPDLTLKYYWFVTEPDGKVLSILRQDEKSIKVPASGSTKVPT